MRRTVALIALAVALLALGTSPAGAITGNFQDDSVHTYVALIAFYDANDEFTHRCSGSLLTPTVFLTAGHCTDATNGATHARLWFQQDAGVGFDPATGTPAPSGYPVSSDVTSHQLHNYGFANFAGFPNTRDVGLVILDRPITQTNQASLVTKYASLVKVGGLDRFAKRRGQQEERVQHPAEREPGQREGRNVRRRLRRPGAVRRDRHDRCGELVRAEPMVSRRGLHVPRRPGRGAVLDQGDRR